MVGHTKPVSFVRFSPVEKALVSCGGNVIKVWNLENNECVKTLEGHEMTVLHCEFLNHGTQLLSSSADGLILLWNLVDSEVLNTFEYHNDCVWSFSVSFDESKFVAADKNGYLSFWQDTTQQEEEKKLKAQEKLVLQEQQLENYFNFGEYKKALRIAFDLDRPKKLMHIFENLLKQSSGNTTIYE